MRALTSYLLRAAHWGTALAVSGCTTSLEPDDLEPAPALECDPDHPDIVRDPENELEQTCCQILACGQTTGGTCETAADVDTYQLSDYPPGSGSCSCGELVGPFENPDTAVHQGGPCCYVIGSYSCVGRPIIIDDRVRLAAVTVGPSDWCEKLPLDLLDTSSLSAAERDQLARAWSERAQYEHASIAAFAEIGMTLLAYGAPARLVARSQAAMADELRHARLALGCASLASATPLGFGTIDLQRVAAAPSLEQALIAAVIEGCVGETVAALELAAYAAEARTEALRSSLGNVAREESEHAALAWAFVAWGLCKAGSDAPSLRARLASAFEVACEEILRKQDEQLPPAIGGGRGFLSTARLRRERERAVREVLRPAARALFSELCLERAASAS